MPVFKEMKIPVPIDEVLRRLGKKRKMEISPQLARLVNEETEKCQGMMTPMGIYERFDISLEKENIVEVKGGLSIESSDLYSWVSGCDELVVMAVTIGDGIVTRVEELVEAREVTRGMIVDAIGSETVEELANVLNRIICTTVRKATTKRYSPGYGDWEVTDQKVLLDLVHGDQIGIEVNEASQMVPEKSISAVIGLEDRIKKQG
jgi:hypothetical protein